MTNEVELHDNSHAISEQYVIIVRVEAEILNWESEKQRKMEFSIKVKIQGILINI